MNPLLAFRLRLSHPKARIQQALLRGLRRLGLLPVPPPIQLDLFKPDPHSRRHTPPPTRRRPFSR